MKEMNERLSELRSAAKLTQNAVAKAVGVSRAAVTQWENGLTKPKGEYIHALAKLYGCTTGYILFGDENNTHGSTLLGLGVASGAAVGSLVIGNAMGSHLKCADFFGSLIGVSGESPDVKGSSAIKVIPVISYVQAGCWTESAECRELDGSIKYITTDLDVGGRTFAVEIQGDSMLPEFSEGDVVLIDPDEPHHPGDFVVAKNGEHEATFKKYKPRGYNAEGHEWFELVPLNDNYPPMRSDICQIKIIGTMVEHRRYRRKKRI